MSIEGMTTSQLVKSIEEKASSNISAFELGGWLDSLDRQLSNSRIHKSLTYLLDHEVRVKGRKTTMLKSFRRLYRVYRDFPPDVMSKLSDQIAHRLSQNILLSRRVRPGSVISDDMCRMPRQRALDIALSETSPESLQARLRGTTGQATAFKNEREIELWFKDYKEELARQFGIEFVVSKSAAGRALGDMDHIFQRKTVDSSTLILVELKDTVNFQDVGQALGQRNEVLEKSEATSKNNYRLARLYPKYTNDRGKYLESNSKTVAFSDIEVWIAGQVFEDSAYFAAKGQDILFFRITVDKQMMGPCHTKDVTWLQWNEFAQ